MSGMNDLTMANPLFVTFLFYAAILVLKTVLMSLATARHRIGKKIFANPEDAKGLQGKVKLDDPDVERVRRAHLNDLENILPFLIICPLYLATGPNAWMATMLMRGFAATRIIHTFVYLNVVPQPSRGLAFMVGLGITIYMTVQTLLATL
ncbi:microsomal glutathione S-transferase 1-like [Pollicipes pollicipes]|uniref:microsomal glutathione S-transferase 1-like n=1 Tax=Pollicipes pollicipes TaxID=41117 RepID=UPI00188593EF|nr:microsomal glutathione S-transferase 1-like [Pollicipes pollicipes]XP_037073175.1 microsomal glutathione S-transferase 1-like [Pollicipes pollicipes]